ncbi:MAG TPA: ABC transporter permease [Solirubrobacteraceae bacterium]|nr:ABC transporter permease [Solirubrobacteraceae bacterium]
MIATARQLWAAFADARLSLRTRRRRILLGAMGIALAAAMLSAAIVIAEGLGNGFGRAVRAAHMGELIVRFDPESAKQAARRISALPDLAGFALRTEVTSATILYRGHQTTGAVGEVLSSQRRQGYAVVAGHNIEGSAPEILIEPGLASAWHIRLGAQLYVDGLGYERVVGFAEGPDDVGYPLAAARFYIRRAALATGPGGRSNPFVNFAEIWLRDPRYVDEVLVQARAESFGLRDLQFATRDGVQVLINQAAGIVIDLLVALSAIALATAAVLLAASSRAEVQRRLRSIGIRRAVGASRGYVALTQALETVLIAIPAATIGTLAGWLVTYSPGNRLLALLNEPGPGVALALPLLVGWAASVAIPVAGGAWPAWTAAGRAVISLLSGADVTRSRHSRRAGRRLRPRGGLTGLGARLVAARPARLAATVTMLTCSTAFVLLMIALAGALSSLETDPQELGKHYQLTADAPPSQAQSIARVPGVEAAEPRYEVHAVDAYSLGEIVDVIAYPRDHTQFEAPPLASGRRLHGNDEAEVGVGLADALGLAPGSQLLLELPSGNQLQLRVAGTVSSLDDEGLVAYVPASALLAAEPDAQSRVAVLLRPGASQPAVFRALKRLGANPEATEGATARGAPLVDVLKTILRAVAIVDGLVCIYALVQACTLTIQERRRTVAVLRACGAGGGAVQRLLLGAVLALVLPAAVAGVVLELFVFGPLLAHLAASYATLDLRATPTEVLATVIGLALASGAAILWVARSATRESVVTGLAG